MKTTTQVVAGFPQTLTEKSAVELAEMFELTAWARREGGVDRKSATATLIAIDREQAAR